MQTSPGPLTGSTALVTGGASGLGEATARVLGGAGATVVILDRDQVKGEQVAGEPDSTSGPPNARCAPRTHPHRLPTGSCH